MLMPGNVVKVYKKEVLDNKKLQKVTRKTVIFESIFRKQGGKNRGGYCW